MGTRSLTIVKDERGEDIITMYRQFDGYLSGHGKELADFLKGFKIVNGIRGDEPAKFANGMGCLAAQIVAYFKDEPGGIYLLPNGTKGVWEKYIYVVKGEIGFEPIIEVGEFSGPASKFEEYMKKEEE